MKPNMSSRILFCAITLAVSTAIFSTSFAGDWSQYHGPNRDRISQESDWDPKALSPEPVLLWKKEIGKGFGSISIANGKAYVMGNQNETDTVYCFDAATGEEKWKFSYPCELFPQQHEGGPCGTPSIAEGLVITVSKQAQVFALDEKTGKPVWQKELQKDLGVKMPTWRFSNSVLIEGDMAIVDVGVVIAYDIKTGNEIWKTKNYGEAYASVVAFDHGGKRSLAVFNKLGLVILDAKTGAETAATEWETKYGVNAATPIVDGNQFFVSSGYGKGGGMYALENGALTQKWTNRLMRNHMNASVLWKGYLYGFDEGTLKCMDFATGEETWKERGLGKGSLMLADGKLIALGERGELVIAEANHEAFNVISRAQVFDNDTKCWTIPVLAHGKIYARDANGEFVCVDVSKK